MSRFAPPFHLPPVEAAVNRRMRVYALLLVLILPGTAAAQTTGTPPAAAADEPLPRFDTTGFVGWRGTKVDDTVYGSSQWDARFVYGGTLGYYWTTNLKLEIDLSATTPSNYETYEPHTIEGLGYPLFIRTDHRITTVSFGGLVIYQFFENVAFHPFVGAGAGVAAIRERVITPRQSQVISRAPNVFDVVVIAEEQLSRHDRSEGFGQVIVGFKSYPGERLFFRSDVLWSARSGRSHEITWRLGFGVDF